MSETTKFPAWAGVLLTVLVVAVILEGYFILRNQRGAVPVIPPSASTAVPGAVAAPMAPPFYRPRRSRYSSSPGWDGNLFQEMERMQARINRLFDSNFSGGWFPAVSNEEFFNMDIRTDLRETDKEIVVVCDLPGMDKNKIDLRIEDGNLVISGKRSADQEKKGKGFYRRERSYGSFERVISQPAEVNEAGIRATYKNGVLTVHLPKLEPSPVKSTKITVI